MPIPKPRQGESKDDFATRCMGDDTMVAEYPDDKQRMAVCMSSFKDFEKEMETVDMNDVPIFSTGVWEGKGSDPGGDKITESVLDSWVTTFKEVGGKVKPRLRLGHDSKKSESITGMASLGWITGLKRKGGELLADFKSVPKKIADLMSKKAIGRFSPGVYGKMSIDGKDYFNVVDHVAVLGSDLPANMDLDGFIDLYYENSFDSYNLKYYDKEVGIMSKEFENKIADLENKVSEYSKDIENMNSENEQLLKENDELKAKIEKVEFEKKESEITSYLEGQVNDCLITPAQAEDYKSLALGQTVEDSGDSKEFQNRFDIVKNIIESSKTDDVDVEESVKGDDKRYEKADEDDSELDKKVQEYMKKNDVTYKEALLTISEGE